MNLSAEEIAATWASKWYRADLESFAVDMARRDDYARFRYVCAILIDSDREPVRWTELFLTLRTLGIKSPFHSPFFMLESDSQLVMVKFHFGQDIKIWNFLTAEAALV